MSTTYRKGNGKGGFTLAELLIVVAIIAVLVAIAIPVFSSVLENSRESTDLSNVRSAYGEVMAAALTGDKTATTEDGTVIYQESGIYEIDVNLEQKQEKWQSDPDENTLTIGGISITDDTHWLNEPKIGGACKVYYQDGAMFLDWGGDAKEAAASQTTFTNADFGGSVNGTWNATGSARVVNPSSSYYHSRRSTEKLVQLEANSTYTLTYTVPAGYSGAEVNLGTMLYTESTGRTNVQSDTIGSSNQKADSGWIASTYTPSKSNSAAKNYQTYTTNSDGSITVTQTINTDDSHVYFGANFRVSGDVNLTENQTELDAVNSALSSLTLTKK